MPRPGHRRHHHPVLGAAHPRRISLQHRHHNTQVHLEGNVEIDRKQPSGNDLRLKTDALTIFPDEDQMKTDRPVRIEVSDGTMVNGTGLFVDNASRKIDINSKVHMVIPARHR